MNEVEVFVRGALADQSQDDIEKMLNFLEGESIKTMDDLSKSMADLSSNIHNVPHAELLKEALKAAVPIFELFVILNFN